MDVFCVVIWPLLGTQEFFSFKKDNSPLDVSPRPAAPFQFNHLFKNLVSKYSCILLLRGKTSMCQF